MWSQALWSSRAWRKFWHAFRQQMSTGVSSLKIVWPLLTLTEHTKISVSDNETWRNCERVKLQFCVHSSMAAPPIRDTSIFYLIPEKFKLFHIICWLFVSSKCVYVCARACWTGSLMGHAASFLAISLPFTDWFVCKMEVMLWSVGTSRPEPGARADTVVGALAAAVSLLMGY